MEEVATYIGYIIIILVGLLIIGILLYWIIVYWTRFGKLCHGWRKIPYEKQVKIKKIINDIN